MKPHLFYVPLNRRRLLKSLAIASAGFSLRGYLAEALTLTPSVEQGPYYPLASNIPLDKDNDLVFLNDSLTPASGIVSYISGRVLDSSGKPIRGALVELWHCDANGYYLYSSLHPRNPHIDPSFAGFGQFLTGATGEYRFRTIKAGLYVGRTRHFHWGITIPGQLSRFTTQTYWPEEPVGPDGQPWNWNSGNDPDETTISDPDQRSSVILSFTPVPGSFSGEVQANWDIVMGQSPVYPSYPESGSLIISGVPVAGPTNSVRFKISVPAFSGYTYELYGNPTLGVVSWAALPFSLSQQGSVNTNWFTASSNSTLNVYVDQKAAKGFYYVSYRVPGSNTGSP
jgi:protocatechuate 3,4-dioxygenase beta subunit